MPYPSKAASAANVTGWGNYADTTYTSGSPLAILVDTDTLLPNNSGGIIESQKPDDIATFYDGTKITGRNGDGILMTIEFSITPTGGGAATLIECWIDIGGSVGELYRRPFTFPKGAGIERTVTFTTAGYTLDTWAANGGAVYIRANGTANVYDIRYLLTRTHKAK